MPKPQTKITDTAWKPITNDLRHEPWEHDWLLREKTRLEAKGKKCRVFDWYDKDRATRLIRLEVAVSL